LRTYELITFVIPLLDLIDIVSTSIEFKENLTIRPSDEANLVPIVTIIKEEMESRYGQKFEKSKRVSLAIPQACSVMLYAANGFSSRVFEAVLGAILLQG
jgi:hypothetical protein